MQKEMDLGPRGATDDISDVALGKPHGSGPEDHLQTVDEQKNNRDLLHLVGAIQVTDHQGGEESMLPTQERAKEKDVSPTTPGKLHGLDHVLNSQEAHEMSPNTLNLSSMKGQSFAHQN